MFSPRQKHFIAKEVERILLSLVHDEMPLSKPYFKLHVDGAEALSWADIEPNWKIEEEIKP